MPPSLALCPPSLGFVPPSLGAVPLSIIGGVADLAALGHRRRPSASVTRLIEQAYNKRIGSHRHGPRCVAPNMRRSQYAPLPIAPLPMRGGPGIAGRSRGGRVVFRPRETHPSTGPGAKCSLTPSRPLERCAQARELSACFHGVGVQVIVRFRPECSLDSERERY